MKGCGLMSEANCSHSWDCRCRKEEAELLGSMTLCITSFDTSMRVDAWSCIIDFEKVQ